MWWAASVAARCLPESEGTVQRCLPICVFAAALLWPVAGRAAGPDFARDVRPILSNRCFKCHGPDEGRREAGLRLDLREDALRQLDSGSRAIVPGHPDDSELIARITSTDPDLVMPPPHAKVTVSDRERRILADWIAAGAEYRPHWAFVKPILPAVPTVTNTAWPRNDIDRFVLQRLEQEGLAAGPEADRATLCRRVHLDLVGVPPTPAELDAFQADAAADAYETLVDRLLASPRYGERWARRWLDVARYADTNGYEKDRDRQIWPYRDWVIRSLNDDMPFDQFTIRQIAGDLLPAATPDDIIATGFHRNTMLNEEGGIDPLEFRYLAMVDRVGTTGATWLGLTTACAQCHTHKFDPIRHADYFALMALLNNADEPEWLIPGADRERQQAESRRRIESLWAELPARWPTPAAAAEQRPASGSGATAEPAAAAAVKRSLSLAERFDAWNRAESARAVAWRVARPTAVATTMPHLVVRDDGSILGSGDVTKSDVYTIHLPAADRPVRAIRLEVLPDESLPNHGPGLCSYEGPKGDFFLSELEISSAGRPLRVERATESFAAAKSTAAAAVDGDMSSGWSTTGEQGRAHAAVFRLAEEVAAGRPLEVVLRFERHFACGLGCFRFSVTDAAAAEARGHAAEVESALARGVHERSAAERELVLRRFLGSAPELAEPIRAIRQLEDSLRSGQTTLVLRERPADNPRKTFLHHRGEYTQPQQEVSAAVPAFLPQLPADTPANRLGLARWLVAADNPLTARVAVNRHWQAFFGRGLVATSDDFGYQGEPPSHPQLLDWLAVTFSGDTGRGGLGWSMKRLHRLIVTTATYRQASAATPAGLARDPHNILLARGPRVRLEAEVIRDAALAAAGLLSAKMYGPGVRPPQPDGVMEAAYGRPVWNESTGEDRFRRSIYTHQKRTAPFAFGTTFDSPTGEACVPKREVSNSALQALTLLNDPLSIEVARSLGQAALAAGPDDDARLRDLARRVLSREFDADERRALLDFLAVQRRRLAGGELDAAQLAGGGSAVPAAAAVDHAAWMLLARAVLNLDEAIVKR